MDAEKITAPNGTVWRLKQGKKSDGSPATGACSWHACTGGVPKQRPRPTSN
jgi:hypothetical protein